MPGRAEEAMRDLVNAVEKETVTWDEEAGEQLRTVDDQSLQENIRRRAEKKALASGQRTVRREHVAEFVGAAGGSDRAGLHWQAAALARLSRAPQGYMRDLARQHVEDYARSVGAPEVDVDTVEAGLKLARESMQEKLGAEGMANLAASGKTGKCPFAGMAEQESGKDRPQWSDAARRKLDAVPEGYCRDLMVNAAETIAGQNGLGRIDKAFVEARRCRGTTTPDSASPSPRRWCGVCYRRRSKAGRGARDSRRSPARRSTRCAGSGSIAACSTSTRTIRGTSAPTEATDVCAPAAGPESDAAM
jgi:hypothetical protein